MLFVLRNMPRAVALCGAVVNSGKMTLLILLCAALLVGQNAPGTKKAPDTQTAPSGSGKIFVERDGRCDATSMYGNTVLCNAWAQMDGRVWMMQCAQQKNNTNHCGRLLRGTYQFDVLTRDRICDPMDASCTTMKERILMKLHSTPEEMIYTVIETSLK